MSLVEGLTLRPQPPGLRHCPLRGLWRRYKGAEASLSEPTAWYRALQPGAGGGWVVGSGVLGQDVGLTELFRVFPQVMETRQVPRSPRVRLLLLLILLLVPWGDHTASGVALPPAGVLRYLRRPDFRLPGRGGGSERWE